MRLWGSCSRARAYSRCDKPRGAVKSGGLSQLWGSCRRAQAYSRCDKPRGAVKSGGSSQWGALSLPQPCTAWGGGAGDTWGGLESAGRWALRPPCAASLLTPSIHPRGFVPGSASALRFPILFRCSFPYPSAHPKTA